MAHQALVLTAEAEGFDLIFSGTTLSVCVADRKEQTALMAWVGDSRCIAARPGRTASEIQGLVTSFDHKPQDPDERRRIIACGGEVVKLEGEVPHRIFTRGKETPGLAMARAMGDLAAHAVGVLHAPSIRRFPLEADQLLLCCSDGVWEFIKSAEAARIVVQLGRERVQEAAQALAQESRDRWLKEEVHSTDDITVIAIWI